MKKILFILTLFVCTLFVTGCREDSLDPKDKYPMDMTAQEFFDCQIRKSEIVDSAGHMYYLYETGDRGWRNYSFSLEHRMDCKKCLDIFD